MVNLLFAAYIGDVSALRRYFYCDQINTMKDSWSEISLGVNIARQLSASASESERMDLNEIF